MKPDKYILKGKIPIPCSNLYEWGRWMEDNDRIVARTMVSDTLVSTVFLGLDHSFTHPEPILFETMIFDDNNKDLDGEGERYSTWEQAEKGHESYVRLVKEKVLSDNT